MDELEELRRDIMAGINDTQLQIMSVVGSGAFGTVYRGGQSRQHYVDGPMHASRQLAAGSCC